MAKKSQSTFISHLYPIIIRWKITDPDAGIFGAPGYTWKGLYKEARRSRGKKIRNFVIAARTANGIEDVNEVTEEEKKVIIEKWRELAKKEKFVGR